MNDIALTREHLERGLEKLREHDTEPKVVVLSFDLASKLLNELDKQSTEYSDALRAARELECLLLNGARSKRAYDKMQRKAEYIVAKLETVSGIQK